jgi:hypothetical protein
VGVVAALLMAAACGKKGPPLAPLIPIPAGIDQISATRVGDEVYVTLTVPSANVDTFAPASIDRIEVFGYTGRTPPPRGRWVEFGTLVATVPVAPPPVPAPPPDKEAAAKTSKPPVPAPVVRGPQQGAQITVVDTLTPEELVPGREPVRDPKTAFRDPESGASRPEESGSPIPQPDPATGRGTGTGTRKPNVEPGTKTETANPNAEREPEREPEPGTAKPNLEPGTRNLELPPLRRFYTAFPWSPRGRPGPPGANAELPLLPVPDAPPALQIVYDATALRLTWEPSGGLIGYLLERTLPEEELPFELDEFVAATEAAPPPGPVSYNVYRSTAPDPFAPPPDAPLEEPWSRRPPAPLNPVPLLTFEFADAVTFTEQRCYTVRAVRGVGPGARIGAASPSACVTAVDTFGPAPPAGLATVASEGAINLIWEPNAEPDLGGYLILRGEAPGATLHSLTTAPITEASYRDTTVTAGMRYVYAVVAIDNRFPVPNLSLESERVEETAR